MSLFYEVHLLFVSSNHTSPSSELGAGNGLVVASLSLLEVDDVPDGREVLSKYLSEMNERMELEYLRQP